MNCSRVSAASLMAAAMIGSAETALAQASPCAMVYLENIRNLQFSTTSLAELNTLFEFHCQADGSVKAGNAALGIQLPSEIPVELVGNIAGSDQRTTNFCRNVEELRSRNERMVSLSSEPLVAALRSFNDCRKLEVQERVVITHQFTPESLVVSVDLPEDTVFRVDGISTMNLQCRANGIPSVRGRVLGLQSQFEARTNFGILCARTQEDSPTGVVIRPGSLKIATGYGLSYHADMTGDVFYTADLAAASAQTIKTLNESLVEARTELAELRDLRDRIGNLQVVLKGFSTGQNGWAYGPTRLDFPGLNAAAGTLDIWVRQRCADIINPPIPEPFRVAIIGGPNAEHEQSYIFACVDF